MTRYEPAWIYNFVLKIAVAIFLGTLAIGLAVGVEPLTALMRSTAGFGVFAVLAWGAAITWEVPPPPEPATPEPESGENQTDADTVNNQQANPEIPQNGSGQPQNGTAQQQFTPLTPADVQNLSEMGGAEQPEPPTAGIVKNPAKVMP